MALAAWSVARPRVPAGDEPHYLVTTQSLLRDGDLRIENNHRDGHYLEYYDAALKPDFMRRGTDRQIYSIHAPGVSVLVLPAFALGGYPAAVLVVVLVVAYALDDNAYLEPGAIWIRGERRASIVVQTDENRSAVLRLGAGPVPNEIRLSAGAWTRTVSLPADAAVDVALPAEALAPVTLSISSGSGFRPADRGGSADVRWLGVFVTWPDTPAPRSGPVAP